MRIITNAIPVALLALAASLAAPPPGHAAERYACMIEPKMVVKLGSQASGVLKEVLVDRGDTVKAGDVIAVLESTIEEHNLALTRERAQSDADVRLAGEAAQLNESILSRRKTLFKSNVVSEEVLEKAQSDAKMRSLEAERARTAQTIAQLDAQRAKALLDIRTIRSPIDGVIVNRKMSPGEFVRDESQIVEIAQIDPLYVHAFLPVTLFQQLRAGVLGAVTLEQPIGGVYRATVSVKDPIVDPASSTFLVRLALPNASQAIPSGIRCTVTFEN